VLREVAVDGIGPIKLFGLTALLSKTPGRITSPPPRLGAHTAEVLQGLGYSQEEAASLKEKGVV
jgi:crotonobetainyl-CoA:carnitine CoA-transferase CaiB-like acyl-CoA transferase